MSVYLYTNSGSDNDTNVFPDIIDGISCTFHQNEFIRFWIIFLTDTKNSETDKQAESYRSLVEVIYRKKSQLVLI